MELACPPFLCFMCVCGAFGKCVGVIGSLAMFPSKQIRSPAKQIFCGNGYAFIKNEKHHPGDFG